MRHFVFVLVFLLAIPAFAQDESVPITASNRMQLRSIARIDFAEYPGEFNSGWVTINEEDSSRFATIDADENIVLWDEAIGLLARYHVAQEDLVFSVVDVAYRGDFVWSVHTADEGYFLAQYTISSQMLEFSSLPLESMKDYPVQIWLDCQSDVDCLTPLIGVEVIADDLDYVLVFPIARDPLEILTVDLEKLVYAPSADPDAVVRIGRIPAPYTVTSSRDGLVRLWDIQHGTLIHEVDNTTGQAAVFGAINHDASHLVWRDSQNESLYLLDFATGENLFIDNLNYQYAQWYFLSDDNSLIIAVNLGFEPVLVVWDAETGERTTLDAYRECSRPQPDSVRFSKDGTTIVIGCDTGLDVWRIAESD